MQQLTMYHIGAQDVGNNQATKPLSRSTYTLTGILEQLQLHFNEREALAETVGHKDFLLLEYLCHLNIEEVWSGQKDTREK